MTISAEEKDSLLHGITMLQLGICMQITYSLVRVSSVQDIRQRRRRYRQHIRVHAGPPAFGCNLWRERGQKHYQESWSTEFKQHEF